MKRVIFLLLLSINVSCGQDKRPLQGETEFQLEMNANFKDAIKSPLTEKDRKAFKGLDFFPFDSMYVAKASFKRLTNEVSFKMKTTTDRLPEYVKYGEVSFILNNENYKLNIYQNVELIKREGYEDNLFLPFLDNTNGEESYAGGRYVECTIPEGNIMIIDFNQAYNPYCAYNSKYSCPIVPRDNYVDVDIKAGVKGYDKH